MSAMVNTMTLSDQISTLMDSFLVPDTKVMKAAEETLKQIMKYPNCVEALINLIQNSPKIHVRQMSALFLWKRINKFWSALKPHQETIKDVLLVSLQKETTFKVRKAICCIIAALAKHLFNDSGNKWVALLNFLFSAATAESSDHREMSYLLFQAITETVSEYLSDYYTDIVNLFARGLVDAEMKVRLMSLKAAGSLVEHKLTSGDGEVAVFKDILKPMILVLRQAIQSGEEETAVQAFEVFDELAKSTSNVVNHCCAELLQLLLEVSCTEFIDAGVRRAALNVIASLGSTKPKFLCKNNMAPILMTTLIQIMTTGSEHTFKTPGEENEEGEEEEESITVSAQRALDACIVSMPSKIVFGPIIQTSIDLMKSPKVQDRHSATIAFGLVAEGCGEALSGCMDQLFPILLEALKDPAPSVRSGACFALGQWAEHCNIQMMKYHPSLIPAIIALNDDKIYQVQSGAGYVLQVFIENMDSEEIAPYVDPLFNKLIHTLRTSPMKLQLIAIRSITAVAIAAGRGFVTYLETIATLLLQAMSITNIESLPLRATATEAIGQILVSVGREFALPYIEAALNLAVQGINTFPDDDDVMEHGYTLFANAVVILKGDSHSFLPALVPILMEACKSTDDIVANFVSDFDHNGIDLSDDEEEGDAPENGEDEDFGASDLPPNTRMKLKVRTNVINKKSSAITALGCCAKAVGPYFKPYLNDSILRLTELAVHYSPEIRLVAVEALEACLISLNEVFPPAAPWVACYPPTSRCSEVVRGILDVILGIYLDTLCQESDKHVVGRAINGLEKAFELFGPEILLETEEIICENILLLLNEEAECQIPEEEGLDEEIDADHDVIIIDQLAELLNAFAKATGPDFAQFFTAFVDPLLKYVKPNRVANDRAMSLGCFADVSKAMGGAIAPFAEKILTVTMHNLNDPDYNVRRNSSFCIGTLCETCPAMLKPHFMQFLGGLRPNFEKKDGDMDRGAVDNAAGAVARIIIADACTSLPLEHVLPVWLNSLPLVFDFEENLSVYNALFYLMKVSPPALLKFMPQLISVIARSLVLDEVDSGTKANLCISVQSLYKSQKDVLTAAINAVPASEQEIIQQALRTTS